MWFLHKIKDERIKKTTPDNVDEEYQRELAFYAYASSLNTIREYQDIE